MRGLSDLGAELLLPWSVDRGAGVWKAFVLAFVVFIPKGARFLGPANLFAQYPSSSWIAAILTLHTSRRDKTIVVPILALFSIFCNTFEILTIGFEERFSGLQRCILVIEGNTKWRFWPFDRRRLCASSPLIKRLSCRGGLVRMCQILLVVSCGKHYETSH